MVYVSILKANHLTEVLVKKKPSIMRIFSWNKEAAVENRCSLEIYGVIELFHS